MPSNEAIQKLIAARGAGLRAASEKRDVDELMSWHSKEAVFTNVFQNYTLEGIDAVREMYAGAYAAIPTFKVVGDGGTATGATPEFMAAEMVCEGTAAVDMAQMGWKAGETMLITGVSLFWFRWEGKGAEWDGSLSDEAVRGWKIVRERAYYQFTNKA